VRCGYVKPIRTRIPRPIGCNEPRDRVHAFAPIVPLYLPYLSTVGWCICVPDGRTIEPCHSPVSVRKICLCGSECDRESSTSVACAVRLEDEDAEP
jgi:hypothetical protein